MENYQNSMKTIQASLKPMGKQTKIKLVLTPWKVTILATEICCFRPKRLEMAREKLQQIGRKIAPGCKGKNKEKNKKTIVSLFLLQK